VVQDSYRPQMLSQCFSPAWWDSNQPTRLVRGLVLRDGIPIVPTCLVSVLVLPGGILIVPNAKSVF